MGIFVDPPSLQAPVCTVLLVRLLFRICFTSCSFGFLGVVVIVFQRRHTVGMHHRGRIGGTWGGIKCADPSKYW